MILYVFCYSVSFLCILFYFHVFLCIFITVGEVYSVEVALDLNELEALTNQRRDVRDMLEKAIAVWKATGTFNVISLVLSLVL